MYLSHLNTGRFEGWLHTSTYRLIMSIPTLPPDLIFSVIDHLHDDKHALLACSQVAQSWVNPSHHHLFKKLHIFLMDPEWLSKILTFLNQNPRIRGHVRFLKLWHYNHGYAAYQPICHHTLLNLLQLLPNLTSLILSGVHFTCEHEQEEDSVSIVSDLDALTIYDCVTDGSSILPYILRHFHNIRKLQVHSYKGPLIINSLPALDSLHAHEISLHAFGVDDLLGTIRHCPQILSVAFVSTAQLIELRKFILTVGRDLRQLSIRLDEKRFSQGEVVS